MIERSEYDTLWFVILVSAALVIASCVLDYTRLRPAKKTATVTTSQIK